MAKPPNGIVTFLFTDIEGSTKLWEQYPEAMQSALARHDAILRNAVESSDGYVVKMRGDGIHAAFADARDALTATLAIQRAITYLQFPPSSFQLRVRTALHTGVVEERDGDYFGTPVNRAARLQGVGHGGQILLSLATHELVRDHLPPGVTLRDLGEHRLKDLIRPEHIFQVLALDLPADFPPLTTLDTRPNNLPAQPTPLIGREKDLAALEQLVRRTDVRLVTLSGPGGSGKTRLGLQVAANLLDDFQQGVYFINLAPVRDPDLVISTIAQTLGVREGGEQSLIENLKRHLRDKQVLLLLDNFEQVISAALLIADLLATSARLKIIVTSREVLRLRGEYEFPVPPLALPDPKRLPPLEQLSQFAGVLLFSQRAAAVKPDFAVTHANASAVVEICARLDGLPLALELAAARCKLLSPQAILTRMENRLGLLTSGARNLPARHQTLRDTIAWSYDLLAEDEKKLFVQLAVFDGGFALTALEQVCQDPSAMDGLASLLDKSLLRSNEWAEGEPWFMMLETIREYAVEQLSKLPSVDELKLRHAQFYVELTKRARQELLGPQASVWLQRLDVESANLRAALAWSIENNQAEIAVQLSTNIWRYWTMRRYLSEGQHWIQTALEFGQRNQLPPAQIVEVMDCAAAIANDLGDYSEGRRLHTQALAIRREIGNPRSIAVSLNNLAMVVENQGDNAQAIEYYEESLGLCRQLDKPAMISVALGNLGNVVKATGDYERAITLQEESLALKRALKEEWGTSVALVNLASALLYRGDYGRALSLCEECIAIHRRMGNENSTAFALSVMGYAYLLRGDLTQAQSLLRESLKLFQKTEDKANGIEGLMLFAFADVAQGRYKHAACLFGAETELRATINYPLKPIDRAEHARNMDIARTRLGEAVFAAAFAAGRALTFDQAVAYALESNNE